LFSGPAAAVKGARPLRVHRRPLMARAAAYADWRGEKGTPWTGKEHPSMGVESVAHFLAQNFADCARMMPIDPTDAAVNR
jgi:hypothetical protein